MGEQQEESKVEIQEKGEIFFFYRPKVEKEEAHSSDDVQRLYIVLKPEESSTEDENKKEVDQESTDNTTAVSSKKRKINDDDSPEETPSTITRKHKDDTESGKPPAQEVNAEKQALMRLMVMGRKSLPDPHSTKDKGRPYWGFVEMVTKNIEDLKDALKGGEYDTATRGHRHTSPGRALGEGIYEILKHINPGGKNKKMHTHLVYKLRFPKEKDEESEEASPQKSLNIEHEASFLIQIKNPAGGGGGNFRGLQSKSKAEFPTYLQDRFGKLRYSLADPTDFLNYVGCEFLLIAASDDISEELGLELETEECETPDEAESVSCSDLLKTFSESSSNNASYSSIAPLLKGIWA